MKKKTYGALNTTLVNNLRNKVQELRKEKQFSETVLATIPNGMDIVDETGKIIYLNPLFEKIFGKKAIGKKCWKIYRDNKKQCKDCPLKRPIRVGQTKNIITEGVAGGRLFQISHTGMKLPNGKKAVLEFFEDITDKKKVEEEIKRFTTLINKSTDVIYIADPKTGRFVAANNAAAKSLGYTNKEFLKLKVRNIDTHIPTEADWKKLVNLSKKKKKIVINGVCIRKNKSTFPVEISINYVTLGNKDYLMGFARNITKHKRDEEKYKKQIEKLQSQIERLKR